MADEEEIVVTLGDATTEHDGERDDPAKVLAQQYKDLEADNAVQKQRREHAEQRAQTARTEADRARQEVAASRVDVVESQYDTVATGLAAAQAEGTAAEQEYAAAFDKGDSLAMAKAQRKIANAEARAVRLDEAKAELEVRRKEPRQQQRTEQQARPAVSDDPIEAYVNGRTEPTKKWLRAHPEWVTDGKKNLKLTAAHNDALAEGLSTDTTEYFEHVENFIGLRQQAQNGNGRETPKRKTSVPAAPVHQSSGGTNGGAREVRLTSGEALAARDGTHIWNYDDPSPQKRFKKGEPIGIQEMARRKEALTKQGAYDRSYTEA